jgi:hypothetical protein
VFNGAARALRKWEVHRGAGLTVCADGPPTVGQVAAMSAPLPLGFIDVTCRVVSVVDEPNRFGFAYGTLPIHPAQGGLLGGCSEPRLSAISTPWPGPFGERGPGAESFEAPRTPDHDVRAPLVQMYRS